MRVTLAICTFQRASALKNLLGALRHVEEPPEEIVVVDSSPGDESEKVIRSFPDLPLRYFRVGARERGLTRQRNIAAKESRGDVVVFFDDDIVPARDFFRELRACWARHPDAAGIGGLIVGEEWRRVNERTRGVGWYTFEGWARREPWRWRARRLLGLSSPLAPGRMPPEGHGRPVNFPPSGKDYIVDFVMGGVSSWRLQVVRKVRFSTFFEGYGLYEDLDFCIRAGREGAIVLCTRAQVQHHHDPSGRPNRFLYGRMVVRNGWYVWRQKWPAPSIGNRCKWWAITVLLTLIRIPQGISGFAEACGRMVGWFEVLFSPPKPRQE